MTEREFAIECVRTLQRAGFRALWAGGCVRDELLGLAPQDYDVATDARPEQVQGLFRRSLAIGAAFGVIEVIGPRLADGAHHTIEVATFRSDGAYTDGRRPDSIAFSNPEEDAQRRDFTINGLFFDPIANELHDFVGGRADLLAKVLRAIGDPASRFEEDKLRVLRAVRIAARFDLTIDPATRDAARAIAPQIVVVSAERVAEELRKMLSHPNRDRGLSLLDEFDLARVLFPESCPIAATNLPPDASFELALARILQASPRKRVEAVADWLKLSGAEKSRVAWLVANRDSLAEPIPLSRLKPLLAHPGGSELIRLHKSLGHDVAFAERVLSETPPDELNPPPFVTGEDLIAAGLKPGPEFKRLLDAVRAAQLDETIRSKEDGLRLARELRSLPPT